MLVRPLLNRILDDEALIRGLADPEARMMVEWLVEQAEMLSEATKDGQTLTRKVDQMCRRARTLGRFVGLWCHQRERGAAIQLAAVERLAWPLPGDIDIDPCELMQGILECEADLLAA